MENENAEPEKAKKSSRARVVPDSPSPDTAKEIRKNIIALSGAIGVDAAVDSRAELNLDLPLRALGREFGMLSRGSNLYLFGEDFVTIDPRDGAMRPMTAERFCSFAEELAFTFKLRSDAKRWKQVFSRLTKNLAGQILHADDFRAHVRELRAVYEMRLPVWRGEGEGRTIELLPPGYDPIERVLTLNTLRYDENLDFDVAGTWFLETLDGFPWAEMADGTPLAQSRSLAAHLVGMLAPFCPLLIGDNARRPMMCYLANQQGSGKTLLAKMALAPVHGQPHTSNADTRPEELEKIVSTAALELRRYLFLDDCRNFRSPVLNMLLTSGRISTRIMGQSKLSDVPNLMQVYVTGNGVDIGPDLVRRSVIVDLFCKGDALNRKFARDITDEWLYSPETRSQMLAVLWAFLRNWRNCNSYRHEAARRASFESFSSLLGSVVIGVGLVNPFGVRESTLGGDEEGAAMILLLKAVASSVEDPSIEVVYTSSQLAEEAEKLNLMESIAGYAKDPKKALGHKLKLLRGRSFTDDKGRIFEFGRRKGNKGATYPLTFDTK